MNVQRVIRPGRRPKWRARLVTRGGAHFLGYYFTKIEAEVAVEDAKRRIKEVQGPPSL
jgi:hypothetical protein